jgi:predicted phosphodiesterase
MQYNIGMMDWLRKFILSDRYDKELPAGAYYSLFQQEVPKSTCSLNTFKKEFSRIKVKVERGDIVKEEDPEILSENVRLAKNYQKQVDLNRIKNKSFREIARVDNAIEEYSKALIEEIGKIDFSKYVNNKKPFSTNASYYGIITLSDLHFNEIIEPFEGMNNSYDFKIASERLRLFATKAKTIFKSHNIKNVFIAMLGDVINSDRRLDELLNSSTNRAKATMLAVVIIEQFILDFVNSGFSVSIGAVTGNESRINEIHEWSEELVTENFDFMIFNILKMMFKDSSVQFIEGDYKEKVISLNGFNVCILHGENIKTEKDIQLLIGRYLSTGIQIHYVMTGHFHSAKIQDIASRSSSLCGGNAYSNRALGLASKASQNIHIVDSKRKLIDSIKVDLQVSNEFEGYNIEESLISYNAKSLSKTTPKKTILEVRI